MADHARNGPHAPRVAEATCLIDQAPLEWIAKQHTREGDGLTLGEVVWLFNGANPILRTTMAINLDALSPAELQALIKNAEAQMQSARKSHIQEVRTKIDGLLKNAGLTIDEVYPRRGGQGKGPKAAVPPKYRNPENPAQTWSGRGKRPLWFSEALKKKGVTAESMLIGGPAKKPAPAKKVAPKATKKAPAKKAARK